MDLAGPFLPIVATGTLLIDGPSTSWHYPKNININAYLTEAIVTNLFYMEKKTSKSIHRIVTSTFARLTRPAQKGLADLIMAFFYNRSFTLCEIASCLSGETTTKHKHKRRIYFLDRFTLDRNF